MTKRSDWKIIDAFPSKSMAEKSAKDMNDAVGPSIESYPTEAKVVYNPKEHRLKYEIWVRERSTRGRAFGAAPLPRGSGRPRTGVAAAPTMIALTLMLVVAWAMRRP